MKYGLGFDDRINNHYTRGDIRFFNIYYVVSHYENLNDILNEIDIFLNQIDSRLKYISNHSLLNGEILKSNRLHLLNKHQVDFIRTIICEMYLRSRDHEKIEWIPEHYETIDFNKVGLYVRYGIVELRALDSLLSNSQDTINKILSEIHANTDNEEWIYTKMNEDSARWLTTSDLSFNIRNLMTNAGMYLSDNLIEARNDLSEWQNLYLNGIQEGHLISGTGCYPWFFNVWRGFQTDDINYFPHYLEFPSPEKFFSLLKGKKLLVVSPFKNQIDRMISEKRLRDLYRDFKVDVEIITIMAPLSTYPNRPDLGWNNSMAKMKEQITKTFESNKIDLFSAACGGYGIPICHWVHKEFKCAAIYNGNWLNTLLGIRQRTSINWGNDGSINDQLRLDSDLSKFKNLDRIDDGRYI